jgi:hypothetical protein
VVHPKRWAPEYVEPPILRGRRTLNDFIELRFDFTDLLLVDHPLEDVKAILFVSLSNISRNLTRTFEAQRPPILERKGAFFSSFKVALTVIAFLVVAHN